MKISDSGLVMDKELPYIAASTDLKCDCKCCGAGLVVIKCSFIGGEIPSADNLGQLQNTITSDNKNTTVLQTNEPYDCQWPLPQGFVSHELTAYLPVFKLFLTQWIMAYYKKDLNQITLNHTTL